MKYIILLADGMADEPIAELGNKTPLMAAQTPNMDELAHRGRNGLLVTVPQSMHPGSEVANSAVLGYDVEKIYEGRGVLEAASMGVSLEPEDMALRCNLVCLEGDLLKNHSAGHISNEEAHQLIDALEKELGNEQVKFYKGVSYRHLLVIKGGKKQLDCTPPHDVPGTPWRDILVKSVAPEADSTADLLNKLILASRNILENHPVNLKRKAEGKDPANSIWPWSPGYRPQMDTLEMMYGLKKSAVISAVDLIQGIGVYAGMEVIKVEGATGLYNTNFEGKAKAAIEALKEKDFVYLHIEAPDEAGHEGDYKLKIQTIENIDHRVLGPIMNAVASFEEPVCIALLPDHPTPCAIRTHTRNPVPFVIYKPGAVADSVEIFNEDSVKQGAFGIISGNEFILNLLDA
ncbi:MAG: cofactor-independent phosphoglycerate mutase [Bacteroidota bacterium]|nr:cofactor-independent phosphoglycerate mutase [Bacteroidota bacterium]MDP4205994.1 cofactor-independent phosphoglycerate mutase [Bacteroidota bacterium]